MDSTKNEISVAVRIRPLTVRENSLLQHVDHSAPFTGDGALSASAPTTSAQLSGRTPNSFVRKVVKALDDRVLVFDPPETNPITSYQKTLLGPSVKKVKDIRYCFDRVFDESATQQDVFDGCAKALVPGVLDGYNATVFAYGATGCGKTHTISGSATQPGIVFLLMKDLFDRIAALKDEITVDVSISYLEIYNETIRDLLIPNSPANLGLRESEGRVVVAGLSEQVPNSAEEVVSMIIGANANRTVSATEANAVSSRSHAVLCVNVKQKSRTAGMTEDYTMATLSIIDLAGSERASATKNKGDRLIEGANINRSLLALGNCINALCDIKKSANHIPYRDSKLTRLLKHSLGGNCRTVMIVCVSPSSHHYDESFNTLQYANRAKEIKTKVTRNVVSVDRHVSQYVRVIYELRQEIDSLKKNGGDKEKKWRDAQRATREEAIREVDETIARLKKTYEEAKDRISSIGSLRAELGLNQSFGTALSAWKSSVFPPDKPADPSYSYSIDNLASTYNTRNRALNSAVTQAENARSMFEASCAQLSRNLTNPLGKMATAYPELLKLLDAELRYINTEITLAICQSEKIGQSKSLSLSNELLDVLNEVQGKVDTDLSLTSDASFESKETLQSTLDAMKRASAALSQGLLSNGVVSQRPPTPPQIFLSTYTSTSTSLSKKRPSSSRSPIPDIPSNSTRPEKLARSSFSSGASSIAMPSKPTLQHRSSIPNLKSAVSAPQRSSLKPSTLSRKTSSTSLKVHPQEERKGVVWKDDAGEQLTEEHSKSVIQYSDTSGDISQSPVKALATQPSEIASSALKATRVLPASSAKRRLGATTSRPAHSAIVEEDEVEEMSTSTEIPPRVLADIGNTSTTSSTTDASFESEAGMTNKPSRGFSRMDIGLKARSSLAPKHVSPRKVSTGRRLSQIGPIRSGRTVRRTSYIDPDNMASSVGSGPPGGSPQVRRASRTTISFQNKVAANAEAIAARRQSAVGSGIGARIAAQRAKREKENASFAFPAVTGPSGSGRSFDVSLDLSNAGGKAPLWK